MIKNIIISVTLVLVFLMAGCSKSSSPLAPETDINTNAQISSLPVYVSDLDANSNPSAGMGALGLFELQIAPESTSAELIPLRSSALVDVLEVVDITNFLQMAPCVDCARIRSVSLDAEGHPVVSIGIKHPFAVGDILKPISGKNRADLHVFNVEGIVFGSGTPISFTSTGESIADFKLLSADGYTGYLDSAIDSFFPTDATVHPYVTHFEDYSSGNFSASNPMGFESVTNPPPSGNLVMAMGCEYDYKDYVFDIPDGSPIEFILAIGCTYAVSAASKSSRFTPEYRIPQHNKKAPSEVGVEIISNELKASDTSSTATLQIKVVDLSHGVTVGAALNEMHADSSVSAISVEIPGVTSGTVNFPTTPISGSGHDPSDPLIFEGVVTNSLSASEGDYFGLVKVTDSYSTGLNESPLLNQQDGITRVDPIQNPLDGLFAIDEFATYQTFNIEVTLESQIEIISPNGGETLWMAMFHEITWDPGLGGITDVIIEWSTDDFTSDIRTIIDSTENNGSYEWKPIPVEEVTTGKIRISDVISGSFDVSDDNFSIALPVWLGLQDEVIVDETTVTWGGYYAYQHYFEEISPAISQDTDGTVHVVYYSLAAGQYSMDSQIRTQNGTSWSGTFNYFGTSGPFYREDYCKVAPSHNGYTWGCCSFYGNNVGWYSNVDRTFGGPSLYCFDGTGFINNSSTKRYPEIATDAAGYIFMFGDEGHANQIYWNKTNQPGFVSGGGPGQVTSESLLISDGIVSKTRSWARQDEGIALIYYTSSGNIMLAETTDAPTNNTWDTTENVWNSADYSDVHTPALVADSNGRLFAVWTAYNDITSEYEILASMREVVDGAWSTPAIVSTSATAYEDVHISCKAIALPTGTNHDVAVVSWENSDIVSAALCPMDLMLFLPEVTVSDVHALSKSPDGLCLSESFGYIYDVLFAWSQLDGDQDIMIRNADLATP